MNVIVIRPFYCGDEAFGEGDELTVPDNQAQDWLAIGLVEPAPPVKGAKVPVEPPAEA